MKKSLFKFIAKRGFLGGNGTFAILSAVIAIVRLLQKMLGTAPKTLLSHNLKPGDVLVVSEPKSR